ncbi:MAG: hypothetical protein JSV49_03810 [Thermoplasmata archaeon]|nr:MAG: hypothetical protein JSV49_03810 [Thermoplasmata archaeon]
MPRCPQCGGSIDFDDDFCFACGAIITPSEPPPPRHRSSRPPRRPRSHHEGHAAAGAHAGAAGYEGYPRSSDPYYNDYPDEPRVTRIERRPPSRKSTTPPPQRSEGGGGKAIAAVIVAIIVILLLLAALQMGLLPWLSEQGDDLDLPTSPFYREYPEGAEFKFDRTVVVSTLDSLRSRQSGEFSYTVKIAQPMDINDGSVFVQDTLNISTRTTPTEGTPDITTQWNNMLIWEDSITSGSDSITVNFHVQTVTKDWIGEYDLDGSISGTVDEINETWKNRYNSDEWYVDIDTDGELDPEDDIDGDGQWDYRIEPTNPDIRQLSAELTEGKTNVFDKLKAIYEYLISDEILDYETIRGGGLPKACTQTLDERKGDCDDYSILFISLARAADIPGRLSLGLLYDPDNDDWIGHGWAEVYVPIKSGGALLGTVDVVNKQFMLRDPYRVTDWIDTGTDIIYNGEYVNNLDFYYYSFTYRGPGKKVSDEYETQLYRPIGDKIRVELSEAERTGQPGGESDTEYGFLPGFEGIAVIVAITFMLGMFYYNDKVRKLK